MKYMHYLDQGREALARDVLQSRGKLVALENEVRAIDELHRDLGEREGLLVRHTLGQRDHAVRRRVGNFCCGEICLR